MAYKRYIRRNGRLYGPYVYKSIRDKDGRVRNIYVGNATDSVRGKRFTLHDTHKGLIAAIIVLAVAASWFFFISPTGLVTQGETMTQSVSIDASFNETAEMIFFLEGDPQHISVTGRVEGSGTARIYAVSDDRTFVIYSNGDGPVPGGSPVTGMATGETPEPGAPAAADGEPGGNESAQPPGEDATVSEEPVQIPEVSKAGGEPGVPVEPGTDGQTAVGASEAVPVPEAGVEVPAAATIQEGGEAAPGTEGNATVPDEAGEGVPENATLPEENSGVGGDEIPEAGTGGPSGNATLPEESDVNVTIPEEPVVEVNETGEANVTEPEANMTSGEEVPPQVVMPVTDFEDYCMETCAVSALGREIKIVVDVEPGTVVYIEEIRYSYSVEVNATNETGPPQALSISIESPANESYGGAPVQFVLRTSIESDWCTYSLDGSGEAGMEKSGPTQFEQPVYDILPGPHYAVFRCSDYYGNVTESEPVHFSLTAPRITITLVEPPGDIGAYRNEPFPVTVEVTCSDADCGDVEIALDPYEAGGGGR